MTYLNGLKEEVSTWPRISVHTHRFGGREFRFRKAEVGHVHDSGEVDIPFPRAFHDELLARGLAEEHRWAPNSGWITFYVRCEGDIQQALWLMRLSYLRYALKAVPDPILTSFSNRRVNGSVWALVSEIFSDALYPRGQR